MASENVEFFLGVNRGCKNNKVEILPGTAKAKHGILNQRLLCQNFML